MENALLVGLSRQIALEQQMNVIANNVANVNTNAFKSDHIIFEDYIGPVARENRFPRFPDKPVEFVNPRGTWRDLGRGGIEVTNNPLDVAIDGDGYFAVQTANGERYTRAGALQLDSQGRLITADGNPVLGDNGPIVFAQTDRLASITQDGRVTVIEGFNGNNAETQRGTLRIVKFDNPQLLQKEGDNLYSAPAGLVAGTRDTTSRLIQGAIEKSNVSGVLEMTRLIDVSRAYQMIANMLQQQSDLHKNAIQQLANVPA
jgi:flagellar basal-body rod protein FlgF